MKETIYKVPVRVTKNTLYTAVTVVALLFVLLPLSVVTYSNFYNTIVPDSFYKIPLKFHHANSQNVGLGDTWSSLIQVESVFSINPKYTMSFHIPIRCLQTVDHDLEFNLGTNKNHVGRIVVECDEKILYNRNNWLVPFDLRTKAPPFLVDLGKETSIDFEIDTTKGLTRENYLHFVSTSNSSIGDRLVIRDNESYVLLTFQWDGFRYYMVRFYFTFFVIGISFFWGISSLIWLCISSYIWSKLTFMQKN